MIVICVHDFPRHLMTSLGFDRFSEIAHDGQYDAPDFSVQVCLAILKICIPPTFYKEAIRGATGPLCPCFSKFLARTTLVLFSLPEAKNPGQDVIL